MSTMTIAPTAFPAAHPARPARTARPAHPRSEVRLTRRGRLVVFLGALFLVLALGVLWGAGSVATGQPGTPEPTRVVQVAPGDTLYAIAAEATDDGDVAAMVERIQDLNALDSGMLEAGQRIRVPVTD